MTDYLIVDANINFARQLYHALPNTRQQLEGTSILDPASIPGRLASEIVVELAARIERLLKPKTIILINAEAPIAESYRHAQTAVELAFWIRCRYEILSPIVFYSLQSINRLLRVAPEHFVLLSPGCHHLRLPIAPEQIARIEGLGPLKDLNALKPFLKTRIDLTRTRHLYANYVGMDLMSFLAEEVWDSEEIINDSGNPIFAQLRQFRASLDFFLLRKYFDLSQLRLKPHQRSRLKPKVLRHKILLIDDMADGWRPIIGQMLFGTSTGVADQKIDALTIHFRQDTAQIDMVQTVHELKRYLDSEKPHLILLDLRLSAEEGRRPLEKLGGYKLLRFLKQDPIYQGLPVIVFTASANAEATKLLLEEGAETVWTKPGLDEGLNPASVLRRYEALIVQIAKSLSKFEKPLKVEPEYDIEELRRLILEKTEYIRYRAALSQPWQDQHFFNHFTDIFLDTSIVIDSPQSICDVYKLAHICGRTHHVIRVGAQDFNVTVPKVVLINRVLDEIIHWSKRVDPVKPDFWKQSLLAYGVMRGLFQDSLVRTEFTFDEDSDEPVSRLNRTSLLKYADSALVYQVQALISNGRFTMERIFPKRKGSQLAEETEEKDALYISADRRVLVLTKESPHKIYGIPARIRAGVKRLSKPACEVKILSLKAFTSKLSQIQL